MPQHPDVGRHVKYVDEHGAEHDALLTAVHGPTLGDNAVNLLYVSLDEAKYDPYGRQVERASSVAPDGPQAAHGRFYRVPSVE